MYSVSSGISLGNILRAFGMLKNSKEEQLARKLFNSLCTKKDKVEQESLKTALLTIMGVDSIDSSKRRANDMTKQYEVFYLNKLLNKSNKKPIHHSKTNTMKSKIDKNESKIIQTIYEVYGQNPSLNDILTIMKRAKQNDTKRNTFDKPLNSKRSIKDNSNVVQSKNNFGHVNKSAKKNKRIANVVLTIKE